MSIKWRVCIIIAAIYLIGYAVTTNQAYLIVSNIFIAAAIVVADKQNKS